MVVGNDRKPLSVKLTREAFEAWEDFAYAHRVSVAAMLEAMGQMLLRDKRMWCGPFEQLPPNTKVMIAEAQKITQERRSRRRS